jgi:16S rRNA (uracil1498-N3)-methyltransferase
MKFMLHPQAGDKELIVSGEEYKYLIKVRRHSVGDTIVFRHRDALKLAHYYILESIDGRKGIFSHRHTVEEGCESPCHLHIGWCIIDPKTVEKTLPMLVELGVRAITFIRCQRSQHQFKLDFDRCNRIMESAIMQCGRTSIIALEESPSLQHFLTTHPEAMIMDFGGETLTHKETFETVIIGCEGGFSPEERSLFATHPIRHLGIGMILRSETAVTTIAALKAVK